MLGLLVGCSEQTNYEIEPGETPSEETVSTWTYQSDSYSYAKEKEELVTVHVNADGEVVSIEDQIMLMNIEGKDPVRDVVGVENISNKNGDEEFDVQENYVYFENLGKDVRYEGEGTKELPFSLSVKYYLDDQEMTADQIKGKSGHVKVEYSFENKQTKTVWSNGRQYTVSVPFVVATMVMLPEDGYENVELDGCRKTSMEGQEAILGFTMPGLEKGLKTLSLEQAQDIEIPSSFSFEMDVTNFQLGFSTSLITSGLLEDEMDFEDLDDMQEGFSKLSDGVNKLIDAANTIHEGMNTYEGYLTKYVDGVNSLNQGVTGLLEGVNTLDANKEQINTGIQGISQGLGALEEAVKGSSMTQEQIAQIKNAISAMQNDLATLVPLLNDMEGKKDAIQTLHQSMLSYVQSVEQAQSQLNSYSWSDKENSLTQTARNQAYESVVNQLVSSGMSQEDASAIATQVSNSIDLSGSTSDLQGMISSLLNIQAPDLSALEMNYEAFESTITDLKNQMNTLSQYSSEDLGLETILASYQMLATQIGTLSNASKEYAQGVTAFTQGIGSLKDGVTELSEGSKTLSDSGKELVEGFTKLKEGLSEYEKGLNTFNQEGISELTKLGNQDIPELKGFIQSLQKVDQDYQSYSGLDEHQEGSVTFLVEVEAIE